MLDDLISLNIILFEKKYDVVIFCSNDVFEELYFNMRDLCRVLLNFRKYLMLYYMFFILYVEWGVVR